MSPQLGFGEMIDKEVLGLIEEGYSATKIREKLGITKHGLASRVRRMRDRGVDVPYFNRLWSMTPEAPDSRFFRYSENVERDPRRASIMHLVDFKRAGHTAAEYVAKHELPGLETDRPCAPRSYPVHGSIYGSPALSCAEMASP